MMEEKCEANPIVDRVLEHAARSRQLIQRIAGQERWGGGGLSVVNGDFWKTRVNLSTCGGTDLPPKRVKNKSI